MKYQLLFFLLLICASSFCQRVTGSAKDRQGRSLSGATIVLHQLKDSSIARMAVADAGGNYEFTTVLPGHYFISGSYTDHITANSVAFEINSPGSLTLPDLVLEKSGNLGEIVITSKKPMVEVKADKMILNVEGTINAVGTDAFELLRKAPGVLIDRDDNLNLAGKTGVKIFIDGRPTPLAGKDLADYLRSLQAGAIEAIEIITEPSAKYDASGNAGIINIRLKKNRSFGTNGSLMAGYNINIYPKYNGGVSLNHRNRNINLFGNYNYSRGNLANFMFMQRRQLDTLFDQTSDILNRNFAHSFKTGLDYFLGAKSTIGVILTGTVSGNDPSNYSRTPISYIPTGIVDRILVADNRSQSSRTNLNYNLNYRYTDTAGRELNIDMDYGDYRLSTNQLQPNYYYHPQTGHEIYRVINRMNSPTDITIYTAKIDYEQSLKNGRLGVGGKSSFVNTDNLFERFDVNNNTESLDIDRSNFFEYNENVNALYINYQHILPEMVVQAGLRMENTSTSGHSYALYPDKSIDKSSKETFQRSYTNLFPSVAVTFKKNLESQWNITFSRRIDRPAYQDLNPFEFKLDEYTFQKGNTLLRPQYTSSFGITHTFKYKLNTKLSYSKVTDVLAQLVDTTEKSKSFLTKKNLATQNITSLNISYPWQRGWYTGFGSITTYYSHFQADFGPGRVLDLDVFTLNVYMQHGFKLGKSWTAEFSGWYVTPSIWQGFSRSSRIWSVDGGVQKQIMKGAGNVKIAVSDIFQSIRWKGRTNFAGQQSVARGGSESRLLKLNFTWRFGNSQVKAARQRNTGSEEEGKRVLEEGGGRR